MLARLGANIGEQPLEHRAAFQPDLAPDQVRGLDAVGAFVDRRDAGVAVMLGYTGFLDIAHAAMDLNGEARYLDPDVGADAISLLLDFAFGQLRLRRVWLDVYDDNTMYQWVDVSCKVYAPQIQSANPDGYWYRIATAPWNNQYYAVANTFWNGDVPGQKPYTHFTDWAVRDC